MARFIWAMVHLALEVGHARRPLTMKSAPTSLATSTTSSRTARPDVVEVGERLLDHLLALLEREQRLALLGVAHGADDDLVEQVGRGLDDLEVAVVDRVERPGIQHAVTRGPRRRQVGFGDACATMVTTVPP